MINLTIYEQAIDSRPWDGADPVLCHKGASWNHGLLLAMLIAEVKKENAIHSLLEKAQRHIDNESYEKMFDLKESL